MVLFSELARRPLVDQAGGRTSILDLAIDLSAGDYPPVRQILIRGKDVPACALDWPADASERGALRVADLGAARALDEEQLGQLVLLGRDILDALVLDMARQRAVRANDLWLRRETGRYVLAGADVSPWAVLRRLSHGLLGPGRDRDILDWRNVEFLRGDPQAAALGRDYHRVVANLSAPQIANLAVALPYLHAAELLVLLPRPLAGKVLERMAPERQTQVITELTPDQAAGILGAMAPDAGADVLGQLAIDDATRVLEALPPDRSRAVQELLRFPPHTAGGIMTNDMVTAPAQGTVAQVREHIRGRLSKPDFVYYVYLTDDEQNRRLRGVVSLRDLVTAPGDTPVAQVMAKNPVTVQPLDSALAVAERVAEEDLNAVPVVTPEGRLLGIVTIDAAMAVITPVAWRDNMPRVFS